MANALRRSGVPFAVVAALALALAPPAWAGTEADAELVDAAQDQVILAIAPGCVEGACLTGDGIDILAAWIGNETPQGFVVHVRTTSGDHDGAAPGEGSDSFAVSFAVAGTTYSATVRLAAPGIVEVSGVAANATVAGSLLNLTIPKSALGQAGLGAVLSGLQVAASRRQEPVPTPLAEDVAPAPGDAPARNYTFRVAPAGNTTEPPTPPANATATPTGPPAVPVPGATASRTFSPAPGATPVEPAGPRWAERLTQQGSYLLSSLAGLAGVIAIGIAGLVRWSR